MDGTTEPIIAVIGHPIAGNPSQFAIERALDALELEWRVLSFDVHPEHIAAALEGFKVTGIAGVMIESSVMPVAAQWYATKIEPNVDVGAIDCLYRDENLHFRASAEQRAWIDETVAAHDSSTRLWIGARDATLPIDASLFEDENVVETANSDRITAARLVVLANEPKFGAPLGDTKEPLKLAPTKLDLDVWPANDGSTFVIDLTDEHPDRDAIIERGYQWIGPHQRRVGMLIKCFERWTGDQSSPDVISDAIEEYLGV
ncbi:MAG: hypothetical protein WBD31_24515 [Rubripirellula sp.]